MKIYEVGKISINTKKSREIYNEIWQTIKSKNSKMVTGFSKETQVKIKQERKQKHKEIKSGY